MQSKATYKIRKNGKQDVFEGSLEDVRKWLRQNSVNSSDAMRREGYQILELDEAWGLVSDFPEFGDMTEREGRAMLKSGLRLHRRLLWLGFLLSALGFGLLAYGIWIPRYVENLDRKGYEERIGAQEALAVAKYSDKISQLTKEIADTNSALAKAKGDVDKLSAELELANIAKRTKDGQIAADARTRTSDAATINSLNARLSSIESERNRLRSDNESLRTEVVSLKKRVAQGNRILPIKVEWNDAVIGRSKVMILRNTSLEDMEVSLTIEDSDGNRKVRRVSVKSGSSKSSRWNPNEFDHEFVSGETVVLASFNRRDDFDETREIVP
jgi:hypothetical protein